MSTDYQSSPPTSLDTEMTAMFHANGGDLLPISLELSWQRDDPWSITVGFCTCHLGAEDAAWVIGRDLLIEGLAGPTGDGDIRLYPSGTDDHEYRLVIELTSPYGHAVLDVDGVELWEFLFATFRRVPAGEELLWVPVDEQLAELLDAAEDTDDGDPGWEAAE
jgi:hypothetical protein